MPAYDLADIEYIKTPFEMRSSKAANESMIQLELRLLKRTKIKTDFNNSSTSTSNQGPCSPTEKRAMPNNNTDMNNNMPIELDLMKSK